MGQSVSHHSIQQQYDIVRAFQDGSALLRHRRNHQQFLLRSICSSIPEQINGFQELLKKRQIIKSPHLLDLIQIRRKQQKNVCSVVHKMYLLIEYPFRSLKDEIVEKSTRGKINSFLEAELWSILYSCCVGLNILYQKKIPHESLTSKQIFISQDGLIKISDPVLLGLEKNYIRILKKESEHIHVSPQIINFLDDCNFSFYDKEKSDVFILGVILLEASLLQPIQLFERQSKKPLLEILPNALMGVRAKYSEAYYEMLRRMLECHSKQRPKLVDIINTIEQDNNLLSCTQQTSTQNLNATGQSINKNKTQKNIKTTPNENWNQPSLLKQSSTHQLNFSTNEKNLRSGEYERSRSQAQNETIIKMLNSEKNKNLPSKGRQTTVHPRVQYQPTPQIQHQMNPSVYIKNQGLNGQPNFVQFVYSPHPSQTIQVVQSQVPVQLSQHPNVQVGPNFAFVNQAAQQLQNDDRFSYTRFGKISLNPEKLKSKPIFSYDIPEINQILKSQSNLLGNHRNISTDHQSNFSEIAEVLTAKNISQPTNTDFNRINLNTTKKQIGDHKIIIPELKFNSQEPQVSYPREDRLTQGPQYYKNLTNPQAFNKISLNGILKENPAKKNMIYSVTEKSEENLETSPLRAPVYKNSSFKINQPQKSPGVQANLSSDLIAEKSNKSRSNDKDLKFVVLPLEGGGKYEGYTKNGMKNGQGKLQFNDGGYYTGEWKDNKMHGYGKLHYQNGQVAYEGSWQNDQFCGFGRIFNDKPEKLVTSFNYNDFADLGQKWIYYEGEFKNDSKHGRGRIRLTNGEVFEGDFIFDSIEGEGLFYTIKGEAIRGFWKDNMLIQK